jgi:putative intracellular protease/amidase
MPASKKRVEYAVCVANEGFEDLEVWKVYQVLPDAKAAGRGCLRVIDESGEDYLYPADRFVAVDFPEEVRARLPRWERSSLASAPRTAVKGRRRLSA